MQRGKWKKGRKILTGLWQYVWHRDLFFVHIDGKDPETGMRRQTFEVSGDTPEFNGWKLLERK